jgi:DEAD/DEAH box helicase domain-containing protein
MVNVQDLIAELTDSPGYRGQIAAVLDLSPRRARYAKSEPPLSPAVRQALAEQGISRLYVHQHAAIEAAMRGTHVAVAAGTASGKTLCFLVPIAEAIQARPTSRALVIYPTKALAQDQLRKMKAFGAGEAFVASTYDGDTPQGQRRAVRKGTHVVLTNPDMLHVSILPYHASWREFFSELKYVVIDEMHVYTGVFGAHTGNVIRRLRRVAAEYGSDPTFICCSATVGNPQDLAESLTGLPHILVDDDGSPQGRRVLVMWNPPVIDRSAGVRRSANMEAAELLAMLVRKGVRTIVFTIARTQTELIARYAREILAAWGLEERVMPYRGGYLPEQRRAIERHLFDGELLGVVATSALELGMDIGSLDAVIMAGYPGRISSLWQRAGRAGRRQEDSLAILVALPANGVDQYLMAHPDYVIHQGNERVLVNPHNPYILAGHLMCAAYELPIAQEHLDMFGSQAEELLEVLEAEQYVAKRKRWYWIDPETYPAAMINIRSVSGGGYDIVVQSASGEEMLLGTIDDRAAFALVHPGAIYLHEGESYLVKELNLRDRRAIAVPSEADYYTQALSASQVSIVQTEEDIDSGEDLHWCFGTVQVTSRVIGYRKRRQVTEEDLGSYELDLPAQSFSTQGFWIVVGAREIGLLADENRDILGSLHALEHALIGILPLFALCDQRDIGGVSHHCHPDVGRAAIFVYDGYPGGVGIASGAFQRLGEILVAVGEAVSNCPCDVGCPSCVQSVNCADGNWPLDKAGAVALTRELAQRWVGNRNN